MLAALLSLGAVHAAQPLGTSQPSNLWTQVTLASQYFDYVPLGYGSTALVFAVQSNATVSTMVMNSAQFSNFNSTGTAAWVYGVNATSLRQAVALSANDDYYLVILAVSSTASVYFTWQTYSFGALAEPQPTGVASYGLYNDSGALAAYTVKASEVAGTADMSSLRAFNSTAALANSTVYGASLQLNAVLSVVDKDGSIESYWCQDVPDLTTNSSSLVYYASNVWNDTSFAGVLTNQSITSGFGGSVSTTSLEGNTTDFYVNSSPNYEYYNLPFDLALVMNETLLPGTGVAVGFGVQVLQNGTTGASAPHWFDQVTIHDPRIADSYFYVSGDEQTGTGNYYDAELVFGGEGDGESTSFQAMSATLGLFYGNGSSALTAFPSFYSVGGDTLEAADNLHVTFSPGATAQVTVGTPDYQYLGNSSGTFQPPNVTSPVPEFPAQAVAPMMFAVFIVGIAAVRVAGSRRTS